MGAQVRNNKALHHSNGHKAVNRQNQTPPPSLIAQFISCTIMKNIHIKAWKPKIIYNLFFFFFFGSEVPLLSHFLSLYLNHRVFIHDMFNFIRHSPFLCFDKCQKKNYIRTYIQTYTHTVYRDIYKSKTHSSMKIQTTIFHVQYHSHHYCHQISPSVYLLVLTRMCNSRMGPVCRLTVPTGAGWQRQCTIRLTYWPFTKYHIYH